MYFGDDVRKHLNYNDSDLYLNSFYDVHNENSKINININRVKAISERKVSLLHHVCNFVDMEKSRKIALFRHLKKEESRCCYYKAT